MNILLGWSFYFSCQHAQAVEQYQKTLEMDYNFAAAHFSLGLAYVQKSMFEEAIAEILKALALSPGSTDMLTALGHVYAVSGKRGEAEEVLDKLNELSRHRYVFSYDVATIYLGLGKKDRAFEWLKKAYEERCSYLTYIEVDPRLDSLRSVPRFSELLKKMGLEK